MKEFRVLIRKFRELLGVLRVVEMTLVFEFLNVILYDFYFFVLLLQLEIGVLI